MLCITICIKGRKKCLWSPLSSWPAHMRTTKRSKMRVRSIYLRRSFHFPEKSHIPSRFKKMEVNLPIWTGRLFSRENNNKLDGNIQRNSLYLTWIKIAICANMEGLFHWKNQKRISCRLVCILHNQGKTTKGASSMDRRKYSHIGLSEMKINYWIWT